MGFPPVRQPREIRMEYFTSKYITKCTRFFRDETSCEVGSAIVLCGRRPLRMLLCSHVLYHIETSCHSDAPPGEFSRSYKRFQKQILHSCCLKGKAYNASKLRSDNVQKWEIAAGLTVQATPPIVGSAGARVSAMISTAQAA